jgi:hypothetical protein
MSREMTEQTNITKQTEKHQHRVASVPSVISVCSVTSLLPSSILTHPHSKGSCFKNDDEKKNRVGQAILLVDVL